MSNKHDVESLFKEAVEKLQSGASLEGSEGAFVPMIKKMIEASLEGKLDAQFPIPTTLCSIP